MKSILQTKTTGQWLKGCVYVGVVVLAACGGDGGDGRDAGAGGDGSNGAPDAIQTEGVVPASAFNSSNSFFAWVKGFAETGGESGEPMKISAVAIEAHAVVATDETSEPVLLR